MLFLIAIRVTCPLRGMMGISVPRYLMEISVPRVKIPPQFHIRLRKKRWFGIPNPLPTFPKLLPFHQTKLRAVAVALRPNAALRKPCLIRPHLILYVALPNFEEELETST